MPADYSDDTVIQDPFVCMLSYICHVVICAECGRVVRIDYAIRRENVPNADDTICSTHDHVMDTYTYAKFHHVPRWQQWPFRSLGDGYFGLR